MRLAILSISTDRVLTPIRNAVLAHAGYGVIPATNIESALNILRARHVCAVIVGNSIPASERRVLCSEAQSRGVPSVVLDPDEQVGDDKSELHINPLEGPEVFLDALASIVQRDHVECSAAHA